MEDLNKIENVPTVDAPIAPAAPAPVAPAPVAPATPTSSDSVVLYATKDIVTESGASVSQGYSRVSKKDAEQLLQHSKVRVASTEEIETYFNK